MKVSNRGVVLSNEAKRRWTAGRLIAAAGLAGAGVAATWPAWADILLIAQRDEESSHIWLVPIVAVWLGWAWRGRLTSYRPHTDYLGPVVMALGGLMSWYGFYHNVQAFLHGGAVIVALGAVVSILGRGVLWRLWPVVVVLGFLVPVPGMVRLQISLPLQSVIAAITAFCYELAGVPIERTSNLLTYNGVPVAVAEACNGMRLMFALLLVSFVFAFTTPLAGWVRALILLTSPLTAILANVIRVVPTVWVYGHYSQETAEMFHDISGWVMLVVAFFLLTGLVRLMEWLQLPVRPARASGDAGSSVDSGSWGEHESGSMGRVAPWRAWAPAAVAVVVLLGIVSETLARPRALDAEPYHAQVREAAEAIPRSFGPWSGQDVAQPPSVAQLLKPNVLLCRLFRHEQTGEEVTFLLAHCTSARDLAGHYPPVCYPANGWQIEDRQPRDWKLDGMNIRGMEYRISYYQPTGIVRRVVANFMIMPDGSFLRDMSGVRQAAADYTRHFFGAAQVQVVTDASVDGFHRDEIFREMIEAHRGLIEALHAAPVTPTER